MPASSLPQAAATAAAPVNPALQTFVNPVVQLAQLSPLAALAALNPVSAVSALGPALRMLNPAINPAAALLAFNPQAAATLAIINPALASLISPFFFGFGGLGGLGAFPGFTGGLPFGFPGIMPFSPILGPSAVAAPGLASLMFPPMGLI